MERNEITRKKMNIKKILIIFAVILIFIGMCILISNYLRNKPNSKTNLVINNNNVTARLKNDVIIENGVIYLSEQDIKNFFDKYIYEDKKYNSIITTSDKKLAVVPFNEKVIEINGSKKQISSIVKKEGDKIYLPISEMDDVYDIEITNIESSNTITMDSLDREQKKAYAAKNISIKYKPKAFSRTIDKVKKGNWLIYVGTDEKGWAKVRTIDGKVGYVKEDKLTNFVTVRENLEQTNKVNGKVNLVWDYFSEYAKAPQRAGTNIEGINVVSPSFFYLNKNGKLVENVGVAGKNYIDWAKENGYKVWPMVSNSGAGMMEVTSEIMNDYKLREQLIEEIVEVCVKYKLDGINIDFENMKKDDVDLYSRFIIELTPRLKEMGLQVSVDVTAPDGADNWSMCFDRNVIGNVADYIIFMAYDQYGSGSNKAGTTAGYNWVETSLKKFVETEEIPSEKVILGIPFYTRLWSEKDEKVLSKVIDMNEVDETIPKDVEKKWNDTLKQYYVEYENEGYLRKMWIEDITSLTEKLKLIKQYNLGGVASWEKDKETDDVWNIISEALK